MYGLVAEADDALEVVERPAGVAPVALMSRVRADGRVTFLQHAEAQRNIDDAADESAAAAHHELAVPRLRQQQLEVRLGADDAGNPAVWHGFSGFGCRRDLDVR